MLTILSVSLLLLAQTLYLRYLVRWHRRMVYLDVIEFLIRQQREETESIEPPPPSSPSRPGHIRLVTP